MLKKIFILLTIPLCSFSFSNIIRSFDDITKRKGLDERFKNTDYDEDVLYNIIKSLSDSLEEKNIHIIFENIQVIEEINMDDSFSDILVDYLLYDKDLVKKEKPRCYRLIQEIIKNESC